MQLMRRFAAAACLAELMEARLVSGEDIDIEEHALLCSTLVRLANHIGIERVMREVGPQLSKVLGGASWSPLQSRVDEAIEAS